MRPHLNANALHIVSTATDSYRLTSRAQFNTPRSRVLQSLFPNNLSPQNSSSSKPPALVPYFHLFRGKPRAISSLLVVDIAKSERENGAHQAADFATKLTAFSSHLLLPVSAAVGWRLTPLFQSWLLQLDTRVYLPTIAEKCVPSLLFVRKGSVSGFGSSWNRTQEVQIREWGVKFMKSGVEVIENCFWRGLLRKIGKNCDWRKSRIIDLSSQFG